MRHIVVSIRIFGANMVDPIQYPRSQPIYPKRVGFDRSVGVDDKDATEAWIKARWMTNEVVGGHGVEIQNLAEQPDTGTRRISDRIERPVSRCASRVVAELRLFNA
jgi:hypothetical protein